MLKGIWQRSCDSITSYLTRMPLLSFNLRALSNMLRLLNYAKSALSVIWTDVWKHRGGPAWFDVLFRTICGIFKMLLAAAECDFCVCTALPDALRTYRCGRPDDVRVGACMLSVFCPLINLHRSSILHQEIKNKGYQLGSLKKNWIPCSDTLREDYDLCFICMRVSGASRTFY